MIITRTSEDVKRPLTTEQKEMLLALKNTPVIPDEDRPEITPKEFADLKRVSKTRRNENTSYRSVQKKFKKDLTI